jgi:hypothetical protein
MMRVGYKIEIEVFKIGWRHSEIGKAIEVNSGEV